METEPTEPPGSPTGVPGRPPTIDVEIQDATGRLDRSTLGWFERHVVDAAGVLGCSGGVRVRVVGDAEMRVAHAKHLGEDSTTDVLTFDLREAGGGASRGGDGAMPLDVDVLVCLDEADRQARERGHPASHELLLYVVHAMLHCLGHDDHDEASFAAMHAREDEVLCAIGVGTVYGATERAGAGRGALVLVIVGVVALVVGGVLATLFAALRDFSWSGLEDLAKRRGRGVVGPRIARILDDSEGHARSILLPRVLCHMTVVVATVLLLERLAGPATDAGSEALRWLAVAGGILVSGVLVWLFGTVIPMSIAAHAAEGTLYRWAGVVRGVHVLMAPAGSLSAGIDEVVRRVVGKERLDAAAEVESEILEAVEEGEREGQINEDEREMIEAVVEFRSLTVEQIMTPRTEVTAIEYSDDVAGVGRALESAGHSRVPVYSGSLDHIDGMLYAKDFLHYLLSDEAKREGNAGFVLRNHLRPAVFVPETKTVRELLSEMLSARVHAAMVTDEYGGTSGMVTLEDIVEEIFGEIEDEFEEVEAAGTPSVDLDPEATSALVDARLRIDDANDRLEAIGLHLPESEDYDTVGGLVVVSLGRIPTEGETLRVNGVVLTVLAAEPTRVTRVRVERAEASEPSEAVQVWDAGGK